MNTEKCCKNCSYSYFTNICDELHCGLYRCFVVPTSCCGWHRKQKLLCRGDEMNAGNITITKDEDRNCLTCKYSEIEDIWNELMCNKGYFPNYSVWDDADWFPVCKEYFPKST